ncbi:MAG: oxygen-independent coproporphyrinogen III oxidase [Alphaproteobacteria bacterium]|nr:oxygen-independent coproporphyrinogen III oxidase [Alphaproteobacteria bacterium]
MRTPADLFSARVPRYTSYPTAPHFHGGVTGEVFRGWLAALPRGMGLSLYLHVPFCDTLCWFCGCHTRIVNHYSPLASYLGVLLKEIETVAAIIGPGHPVTHIHWGGGSPTMLSPDDVRKLAAALAAHFTIAPDAEFAIEIDPRGLKDEMIAALAEAGVNRASIGVQDCDETVQRAINRIQPFEVTRSAVERLRAAGIAALNIDLIYGLPHQTQAHVARTIEMALTLAPQRFAVFGYAHVPNFKKHMKLIDEKVLPDAEERLAQFELAHAMLCARGYVAIGLDHFARPGDSLAAAQKAGKLARNFQGYTTDDAPALIGLGASSISALPQGYAQNMTEVPEYRKAIEAGELTVVRGIALNDDDRLRRAVIERLMCDLAVDLDAIGAPFGKSAADFRAELAALVPFAQQHMVRIDGARLVVAPESRAAVRLVAAAFDSYLAKSSAVHAVAV